MTSAIEDPIEQVTNAVFSGQRVFAQGMTYVALSRLQTIEGLSLLWPLRKDDIIRDQEVINFYRITGGI